MEARPKLKIELTRVDKVIEGVSLIILILLWIVTISHFSILPDLIPSHFNAAGQADDFRNKSRIFSLPIVATILYIGMTLLNKYPHLYNYPATVTAQNALRLYTSATRLIRILKLIVVIIFSGIVLMIYKSVLINDSGLGTWFLPAVLALIFIPTIIYLLQSTKQKSD